MKIPLNKILPNPYRDIDNYQIRDDKIDKLTKSITETSFWDNLLARPCPSRKGFYEIAFGHHRIKALKKLKYKTIDIPVKDLPNDQMLKMMANENMSEWDNNADLDRETVTAVIRAAEAGDIEIPLNLEGQISKKGVAKWLGWDTTKAHDAIDQLVAVEKGMVDEVMLSDMSPTAAGDFSRGVRKLKQRAVDSGMSDKQATQAAKTAAKSVRKKFEKEKLNHKQIRDEFALYTPKTKKGPRPDIDKFIDGKVRGFAPMFDFRLGEEHNLKANNELRKILDNLGYASVDKQQLFIDCLDDLAGRIQDYSRELKKRGKGKAGGPKQTGLRVVK